MTKLNFDLLDDKSAMETIETVAKLAEENNIDWALAGGLAVILYGSDRLTKDIDIIADKLLPVSKNQIVGRLKQGGERYMTRIMKRQLSLPEK